MQEDAKMTRYIQELIDEGNIEALADVLDRDLQPDEGDDRMLEGMGWIREPITDSQRSMVNAYLRKN